MKNIYEAPEMTVEKFDCEDVIMASGVVELGDNFTDFMVDLNSTLNNDR